MPWLCDLYDTDLLGWMWLIEIKRKVIEIRGLHMKDYSIMHKSGTYTPTSVVTCATSNLFLQLTKNRKKKK